MGVSAKALELARGMGRVAKALALVDTLAHFGYLGYEIYTEVVSGNIHWDKVAFAALIAGGPVLQRSRAVALALATGSGVMLFLGEPFDAAPQLANDLYAAAAQYGDYSQCFVDGALQAFSTYAQEAAIAKYLGVASTFVDWAKLELSRDWLAFRQIAALSAFPHNYGPYIYSEKFSMLMNFLKL